VNGDELIDRYRQTAAAYSVHLMLAYGAVFAALYEIARFNFPLFLLRKRRCDEN
jgi:hypothetical protein